MRVSTAGDLRARWGITMRGRAASKQKGSAFERTVCTQLSRWITKGKRSDCFWRSAMSGGRATVAHKKGRDVRQAGDITAVAEEGHRLTNLVYIECKHYAQLQLDSFILTNRGNLAEFWRRTCNEAAKRGKEPWLIARQNHKPTILITPFAHLSRVGFIHTGTIASLDARTCSLWLFDAVVRSPPPVNLLPPYRELLSG